MPLFKVTVRAEECREYFIEAKDAPEAGEIMDGMRDGDYPEPDKCYWNTEDVDDPEEVCQFCRQELNSLWNIPCCERAIREKQKATTTNGGT